MLNSDFSQEKVIATVNRTVDEKTLLKRKTFMGHELFDLRIHYVDEFGNLKPTKKGVTFKVGDKDLPRILKAWQKELDSLKN